MIKGRQKTWHQNHTQNLEGHISDLHNHIFSLDDKGEEYDFEVEEVQELHSLSENLFSLSKINTNMQWQKSRINQ